MAPREPCAQLGTSNLESDHRYTPFARAFERGDETARVANGLQQEPHHPRTLEPQGVVQVVRRTRDQLLPGGDDQVVAHARIDTGERVVGGPGVGDERDGTGFQTAVVEPRGAGAGFQLREPQAVGATDRNPRLACDAAQPVHQQRRPVALDVGAGEDHRRPGPMLDCVHQRRLDAFVAERQHHELGGRGQGFQRRMAGGVEEGVVARVDRVHRSVQPAEQGLANGGVTERMLARRGADHRDRLRLGQRTQRMLGHRAGYRSRGPQ